MAILNARFGSKLKVKTLLFAIAVLLCQLSIGQNTVEILFKSLDKDYVELVDSIKEIENSESKQIISFDDSDFEKFNDLDTRYLMFFKLSIHYAAFEEYDKCFEILKKRSKNQLVRPNI